jgi:hypothetical protein
MVPLRQPRLPVSLRMRVWRSFLYSFFKSDWTFEDYPVHTSTWVAHALPNPFPWEAYIVNWPRMHVGGMNGPEAIEKLRKKFESYVRDGAQLPRPGWQRGSQTNVPPTERIAGHRKLKHEFLENIVFPWALISDDSTLLDLDSDRASPEDLAERIRNYFGVNVSDVSHEKIVDIFDRIEAKRAKGS